MADNPIGWFGLVGSGLDIAGRVAYGMFNSLADPPQYHSPYADYLFNANGYNAAITTFRTEDRAKKAETVIENAARISPGFAQLLRANKAMLDMVLRMDTPQFRQQLKQALGPPWGEIALRIIDSITGNEPGMEDVFRGFGDTFGTRAGNEAAIYATNYASNIIAQQGEGGQYSAGALASTLSFMQEQYGYNFQGRTNARSLQSADSYYRDFFNKDTDSEYKSFVEKGYLQNLLSTGAIDDEHKKAVEAFINGNGDRAAVQDYLDDAYKFAYQKGAAARRLAIETDIDAAIRSEDKDSPLKAAYISAFDAFKEQNKTQDFLKDKENITLAELRDDANKTVFNEFVHSIQLDALEKNESKQKYAEVIKQGQLSTIIQRQNDANAFLKKNGYGRVDREVDWLLKDLSLKFGSVGQASWDRLSEQAKQDYLDAADGDINKAQANLGAFQMNKYGHEYMKHRDFGRAADTTHYLAAVAPLANMRDDQIDSLGRYFGSVMQTPGLRGAALNYAVAFKAAADRSGANLSSDELMAEYQTMARALESSEGATMQVFMGKTFNKGSEMAVLQEAVASGNVTPEQLNRLYELNKNQTDFINAIARDSNATAEQIERERLTPEMSFKYLSDFTKSNTQDVLRKLGNMERFDWFANEESISLRLTDSYLEQFGAGKGKKNRDKFARMMSNVIQKGGMNAVKWISGEATKEDIARLKEIDPEAAEYVQGRIKERNALTRSLKRQGKHGAALREAVSKGMGSIDALQFVGGLLGGEEFAEKQGVVDTVHATDIISDETVSTKGDTVKQDVSAIQLANDVAEYNAAKYKPEEPRGQQDFLDILSNLFKKNYKSAPGIGDWVKQTIKSTTGIDLGSKPSTGETPKSGKSGEDVTKAAVRSELLSLFADENFKKEARAKVLELLS